MRVGFIADWYKNLFVESVSWTLRGRLQLKVGLKVAPG
jgi:hypothetical protein